jgi:hypothetical protein
MDSYSTQIEYSYSSSIASTTITSSSSSTSTATSSSYPLIITRDTIPLPPPSYLNIPTLQAHGKRLNFLEQHALELRALYYYREENGMAHPPTGSVIPPIMKAGRKAGVKRGGVESDIGMTALKATKPTTQPKPEASVVTLSTALPITIEPTPRTKTKPETSAMTLRTALAAIKPTYGENTHMKPTPEASIMSLKIALATTKPALSQRKSVRHFLKSNFRRRT